MNNTTSKVYTPIIVKEPAPPIYRPPVVEPDSVTTLQVVVNNMYLTNTETEEGTTIWYLNIVDNHGQVFVYRLDVGYSK